MCSCYSYGKNESLITQKWHSARTTIMRYVCWYTQLAEEHVRIKTASERLTSWMPLRLFTLLYKVDFFFFFKLVAEVWRAMKKTVLGVFALVLTPAAAFLSVRIGSVCVCVCVCCVCSRMRTCPPCSSVSQMIITYETFDGWWTTKIPFLMYWWHTCYQKQIVTFHVFVLLG